MSYIRKMGGYRSYRPATSRRNTSRRTYQRPKAKPGPRATIKRSPKPVVRRTMKPKAISRPSPVRKTSVRNIPKVKVTPKTPRVSKPIYPGMPSNVRAILEKQEAAKKRQAGSKAGMPSKVANILKEQEAAQKASASKGTNQSGTTNSVNVPTPGVSYQKSTQNQESNASTTAKIYQKPSVTASAPTHTKVVQKKKPVVEDLNLSEKRNRSTKGQEEKAKKTQTDKIVVREQGSIGITNRDGRRVLVERDYSKKKETKDYRSLRIRNHLSKAQNDKGNNPAQMMKTSLYIKKRNLSRFNKEISNKEKVENRTINIHRDGTTLESLKEELYGLDGVKRNPEYLFQKINTREETKPESKEKNPVYEPIRINSASDYQAYVREQKRAELQKYDYQKNPDAIRINSTSDYQTHVREEKRKELQKYDYVKDPDTIRINSGRDYAAFIGEEFVEPGSVKSEVQKQEQKEAEELIKSVEEEYNACLDKQKNGEYTSEYLENIDEYGACRLYDRDIWEEYTQDINGDYMMNIRYNLEGTIELEQMGFTFDVEGLNVRDMSMEEYVNTMGPIWELSYNHRTEADFYDNLKKSLAVVGVSYAGMAIMAGGSTAAVVKFSAVSDTALDSADVAASVLSGDKAGAVVSAVSMVLPEVLEGVAKNGKNFFKNSDNILEGLDDAQKSDLFKVFEEQGIKDIDKISINDDIMKISTKNGVEEITGIKEVFETSHVKSSDLIDDGLSDIDWNKIVSKKGENRIEHIAKHNVANPAREMHGVFNGDGVEMVNNAWNMRGSVTPVSDGMGGSIYNIPYQNAGVDSGFGNVGAQMDYITIVTMENTSDIITAFPSYGEYLSKGVK